MNKTFFKALFELALLTYVAGFLGLVAADGFDVTSLGAWKAAAVAAFPPVLAILYGAFARLVGNYASPFAVDTRPKAE